MVTSVIELSDKLYKFHIGCKGKVDRVTTVLPIYKGVQIAERASILSRVCANANDLGLPLLVVQQLLKGTDYEQLIN